MADHDDWTADDDAQLRAALTSLRADVEAAPMPDVRFVKARGMARRRQRLLTWTAAAAAAAVVVGTVGYSQFGREAAGPLVPATRSGTTSASPSPSTTDPLDQPGALPLLTDWTSALGLTGTVRLTPVKPFEAVECLDSEPGTKVQQEGITRDAGGVSGGQVRFRVGSGTDIETAVSGVADDIQDCQAGPGFHVNRLVQNDSGALYAYTAGDAGSGWFLIVHGPRDLAVLQVVDPDHATPAPTADQVTDLAEVARRRLERYGTGATSAATTTMTPTSSGPKAINEKMPVTGPAPTPSSGLFVAASQWTDPQFAKGAQASAGEGDPQDSTGDIGVFCESTDFLAGFGGQLGEVEVRAGTGDANVIGHQRVRVDQSADASQAKAAVSAQVAEEQALLVKGCAEPDGKVTATKGPTDGTYLLTKKVTGEASGTDYRWVGVTALTTPGAWATVVFHGTDDGQGFQGTKEQGFAELDRLLALARQK